MILAGVLLSYLALGEAKISFNKAHRLIHPNQVPSHVKDEYKIKTVKASTYTSVYFVVNEFIGGADCSGWPNAQFGIAFDSCFSNSDTTTAK